MGCTDSRDSEVDQGERFGNGERLRMTEEHQGIKNNTQGKVGHLETAKMGSASDVITILHFNDVYNIEPREQDPVGGAARFVTALRSHQDINPIILFSGDAFNPSLMSAVTKGKQMVPVLNALNIQCACYGNHDFDFGVDVLSKMAAQCNFPWLMSNVYDNFTEKPLANGLPSHLIEWQGHKVGLIGLVEEEWIATLATVDPDDITFISYVTEGRKLARQLRDQGAVYVIALTHMRWPNDRRLAEEVAEIDLILGGHDHDYNTEQVKGKWVIKSGTDFREYSEIRVTLGGKADGVTIKKHIVDSSVAEDPDVKAVVSKYLDVMGEKMENILGYMDVDLDGCFSSIRTKETNLGNFITDIMLETVDADLALLNSGTLRSDRIHPRGQFKLKDLLAILPMVDPLVVVQLTGQQVMSGLENGVSQYPTLEGRFPQVAGVEFAFDPSKPPGSRVNPRYVRIQGEYIDLDRSYKLVTKHYLAEGKDGYDAFKEGQVLVNDEEGPRLNIIVQNHFMSVKIIKGQKLAKCPHRQSLISINRRRSLVRQISISEDSVDDASLLHSVSASSLRSMDSVEDIGPRKRSRAMLTRKASIQSVEMDSMPDALSPKVDGRIIPLDEQRLHDLEQLRLCHDTQHMTIPEACE